VLCPTHFIPLLPEKSRGYSFGVIRPVLSHGSNFFCVQLKYFLLKNYIKGCLIFSARNILIKFYKKLLKQIDMRERTAEPRQIFSVYLPVSLYQKLVDRAGKGKINTFIKQVLEEKLKEEQNQKEQLRKRLIEAYKREAKSKEVQEEMAI
jgi:hypothetical protein